MLLYFVDNDIIIELASYELFWPMIASLKAPQKNIRVLYSASSYIESEPELRRKYKQETLQRAKQIADGCESIDKNQADELEFTLLVNLEGVDPGEALLVASTNNQPDCYIVTCDKKFLKALTKSNLINIKQRLYKKIICLEQLLINLINNDDFEKVRRRIINSELSNYDINEAFADGKFAKQEKVLEILEKRVEELRQKTGDLLVDTLPVIKP